MADASHERMTPGFLRRMEHLDGTLARRDYDAVGEADPLVSIFLDQLIARGPIIRFVLAPIGMNKSSEFRRQQVGEAFHETTRMVRWAVTRIIADASEAVYSLGSR